MWWRKSATYSTRPKPRKRSSSRFKTRAPWFPRLLRVYGWSMAPVLNPGEVVVVREGAYQHRDPRRGDIVAARPTACPGKALVKRITGLPYERIVIDDREWCLGREEFFLLGDQQAQSTDSRAFGPVKRHELVGPVRLRLWPWTIFPT